MKRVEFNNKYRLHIKALALILSFIFILEDTGYAFSFLSRKSSLRQALLFDNDTAIRRRLNSLLSFITDEGTIAEDIEMGKGKIWLVPVEYANSRIARELTVLFAVVEEFGITEFMLGGGTARDFAFGVFLGIDVIDRSSDLDIIAPQISTNIDPLSFIEKFENRCKEKIGHNRFPRIDPVLGYYGKDNQLGYRHLYKGADFSLALLLVKKIGQFYIIIDTHSGVEDIINKTLRFVNAGNLNGQERALFETRIFDRYIPYWAKLTQHGFNYDGGSRKIIDDYLQRKAFSLAEILNGIEAIFCKAQGRDEALMVIRGFGLIGLLKEKSYGLDLPELHVLVSQLNAGLDIRPESILDSIEDIRRGLQNLRKRIGDILPCYRLAGEI